MSLSLFFLESPQPWRSIQALTTSLSLLVISGLVPA